MRKTKAKTPAQSKTGSKAKPKAKLKLAPAKKPQLKAKAKPPPKAAAKKKPSAGPKGSNVLWKLLEEKQEQRKQAANEKRTPGTMFNEQSRFQSQPRHDRFAKFAGPRRRAA